MLLTVKKQIEETVEVKTPAYYKDILGNHHFINEAGQVVTARRKMINMWDPDNGKVYTEEVETILRNGTPCTKEDFDKVYAEAKTSLDIAAGAVEF